MIKLIVKNCRFFSNTKKPFVYDPNFKKNKKPFVYDPNFKKNKKPFVYDPNFKKNKKPFVYDPNFKNFFKKSKGSHINPKILKMVKSQLNYYLVIKQTTNNIFLTLTNVKGETKAVITGGFSEAKGKNRSSHHSIHIISKILLKKLYTFSRKKLFNLLCIFLVTSKNSRIDALLRSLSGFKKIIAILGRIRIPHNGVRPKKLRRL